MRNTPETYIVTAWIIALIVWAIGAFTTKRTVRRQSSASRWIDIGEGWLAGMLLFSSRTGFGPLDRRFVPRSSGAAWVGAGLTIAGVALAIAARFFLGRNWSGTVTIKEGHTLVRTGPYTLVRHPIYSGFLLAILGTALAMGEFRALLAAILVFLLLAHKIILEERFMMEQFGAEYAQYRRHVKALIPFVW